MSTQNVIVARFARNVECDFFSDFQTPWIRQTRFLKIRQLAEFCTQKKLNLICHDLLSSDFRHLATWWFMVTTKKSLFFSNPLKFFFLRFKSLGIFPNSFTCLNGVWKKCSWLLLNFYTHQNLISFQKVHSVSNI